MKHIRNLTTTAPAPAKAQSLLEKSVQIGNLRQAAAAIQEFVDIILKTDTFGN